jgi:hypothetical protein
MLDATTKDSLKVAEHRRRIQKLKDELVERQKAFVATLA